ncbi:MAG: hypothetical protein HY296_01450 [Thaumarchaeota archaeon]|nr:hypothetical protein [Nitrososphaerota archaeon]
MSKRKGRLVRTTIAIPASLKEKMAQADVNWSEAIREMVSQRLEDEGQPDVAAAVILNERVRRPAPKGWSSLGAIKQWRRKTSS